MSNLSVSVIIPTFNRADLIGRAVDSVLNQFIKGDELIVVDDGSTDNTERMLERYSDRLRYIRIPNSGAGAARNRGLREARNSLVAFLDSDDEWMPGKLQLQRRLMESRPDILYSFTDFAVRLQNGEVIRQYLYQWHRDPRSWDEIAGRGVPYSQIAELPPGRDDFMVYMGNIYYPMAAALYTSTITVVVRREEAGEALRFAEDLPLYEDWVCFGRLSRLGNGAYLDCETAWNFGHGGGRLTDADAFESATVRLEVLRRVWGSDPDFLARHEAYYREVLERQYVIRAAGMISRGDTLQARAELRRVSNPPVTHRFLAALPGPIAQNILRVRRFVRKLFTGR